MLVLYKTQVALSAGPCTGGCEQDVTCPCRGQLGSFGLCPSTCPGLAPLGHRRELLHCPILTLLCPVRQRHHAGVLGLWGVWGGEWEKGC